MFPAETAGVEKTKKGMVFELLMGCGMIRRSEKRRLIGADASVYRAATLDGSNDASCVSASQNFHSGPKHLVLPLCGRL